MTLRAADLRFALPHPVRSATVLTSTGDPRIRSFGSALRAAGVQVATAPPLHDRTGPTDLVVAAAGEAEHALGVPARTHLVLGRPGSGLARWAGGRRVVPLLVRGRAGRPETVVPTAPPSALQFYLERMSSPPLLTSRLRNRAVAALSRTPVPVLPLLPRPAVAVVVTGESRPLLVPALVRAAKPLGVPPDAQWVLALGRGDDLQRAVFHLLHRGERRWVLKFSRVEGARASFARDERGLALLRAAGGAATAHAPAHLGRLEVGPHSGSLETAAPGRPLLELLGRGPAALVDRVARWVVDLGCATAAPAAALQAERRRLEQQVLPAWRRSGAPAHLVEQLPDVPAVLQHNDLGSWNVMTDGQDFMAIDWESARAEGLPLWDLCYFLADALPRMEGPAGPTTYTERTLALFAGRSAHSPVLFRWVRAAVRALQIPPDAVGPLVTLCWLHHGLSAEERGRTLTTSTAAPLGHLASLGRHWLAHPALGPAWSAWEAG